MDAAVTAAGAVVFDVSSGQLLYSKAGEERMYPASMTKLLTAVTALRYGGEELIYTVGDELELVAADASPRQHPARLENDLFHAAGWDDALLGKRRRLHGGCKRGPLAGGERIPRHRRRWPPSRT